MGSRPQEKIACCFFFFLILNTTMITKTFFFISGLYTLLSLPLYKNYSKGLSITLSLRSLEKEMATNPFQYSCLENAMDRGASQTTVHQLQRVRQDQVTMHACTYLFQHSCSQYCTLTAHTKVTHVLHC